MLYKILLKQAKVNQKYFENYRKYAEKIKAIASKLLKDCKVFVFGSVVEGKALPSSDIDVLIVSKNTPKKMKERAKIVAEIFRKIGIFSPFEIHLITEEEFEWYKRFVKKFIEV